jgi:chromosome segregation ATPase
LQELAFLKSEMAEIALMASALKAEIEQLQLSNKDKAIKLAAMNEQFSAQSEQMCALEAEVTEKKNEISEMNRRIEKLQFNLEESQRCIEDLESMAEENKVNGRPVALSH